MQLFNNRMLYVAGNKKVQNLSFEYFDNEVINFLSDLSEAILKNKKAKNYADLISFGFWIRKKNIFQIKSSYSKESRYGHGLAFHITPSNVALNFAYSFVVSLLAGNSNILKVSKNNFQQNILFFSILKKLINTKKHSNIKKNNLFVEFKHDDEIIAFFSKKADCRIVWGSDETINHIKKFDTKPLCKDLFFPDRYSISLLDIKKIEKLRKNDLSNLAKKMFFDIFLYNQNACTSPHLIIWIGKKSKNLQKKFWSKIDELIKKNDIFEMTEKKMYDKYFYSCHLSAKRPEIKKNFKINSINFSELTNIPKDIDKFRIGNGYIFEIYFNNINKVNLGNNKKIQTLTYFGIAKKNIKNLINLGVLINVDRVVPVGRAFEFSEIWDGYDCIRSLSKITYIR